MGADRCVCGGGGGTYVFCLLFGVVPPDRGGTAILARSWNARGDLLCILARVAAQTDVGRASTRPWVSSASPYGIRPALGVMRVGMCGFVPGR